MALHVWVNSTCLHVTRDFTNTITTDMCTYKQQMKEEVKYLKVTQLSSDISFLNQYPSIYNSKQKSLR